MHIEIDGIKREKCEHYGLLESMQAQGNTGCGVVLNCLRTSAFSMVCI